MLQLQQMRTRVGEILEDSSFVQWPEALVNQYLNDAAQDFAMRTKCYRRYSSPLSANGSIDVSKPFAFYSVPSDTHELESVWVNGYHVPQARIDRMPYQWDIEFCNSTAEPSAYLYGDFGLEVIRFWPYPSDAAFPTVYVYYTALPPAMTTNTATPTGIPARYNIALVYYTVAMCYRKNFEDADKSKSEEFMALYLDQIRDCQGRIARLLNAEGMGVPYRHL